MRIAATWNPTEVDNRDLSRHTVIVIDCFRASTSIVAALAAGAKAVYPFLDVEDARKAAAAIPGAVLAGERGGRRIEGFDLGNSPGEFTPASVGGRDVVMTTTNGTRLLLAVSGSDSVFVAGFVNARATAAAAASVGRDILLAAAGTEGHFSIEDALCAGMLAATLAGEYHGECDDAAEFARLACERAQDDLAGAALSGLGAANVMRLGLREDLDYALRVDALPVVAKVVNAPLRVMRQ
jgi:2-phosphosulfolactate phosphatase